MLLLVLWEFVSSVRDRDAKWEFLGEYCQQLTDWASARHDLHCRIAVATVGHHMSHAYSRGVRRAVLP